MQVASPDAFALAIGDSIPLQEVERQLFGGVRSSVQTRNVAGYRDWSVEDGQLFSRLRVSGRQVDIVGERLLNFVTCGWVCSRAILQHEHEVGMWKFGRLHRREACRRLPGINAARPNSCITSGWRQPAVNASRQDFRTSASRQIYLIGSG
jgi:hypothetical protein